jgi:hypothetical protein
MFQIEALLIAKFEKLLSNLVLFFNIEKIIRISLFATAITDYLKVLPSLRFLS